MKKIKFSLKTLKIILAGGRRIPENDKFSDIGEYGNWWTENIKWLFMFEIGFKFSTFVLNRGILCKQKIQQ